MENNLAEINSLLGVMGSLVCDPDGNIIVQAMPDTYDVDKLSVTARVISQTLQALDTSGHRIAEMDLQFEGGRVILKNLRGGTLAILCARNINLPLLNMTASVAAKKIAAQLKPKSAAAPREPAAAEAKGRPPAPTPAPTPSPAAPPMASPPAAAPASSDELLAPPLFRELGEEASRIIATAKYNRIDMRVLDSMAVWLSTTRTRWLLAPIEKREIHLGMHSVDNLTLLLLFQKLGYDENKRFNAIYGKQRLHYLMPSRDLSVDVFLDSFSPYHRLDMTGYLSGGELALVETPLLLTRLQPVEISDMILRELCALLIEHELSVGPEKGKIDASAVTQLCSDDWGWFKTVIVNMDRLRTFAAATLTPADRAIVTERIQRLQQSIASAPKSLRWQTRARLGETVRWYETPIVGHPAGRPDMAFG